MALGAREREKRRGKVSESVVLSIHLSSQNEVMLPFPTLMEVVTNMAPFMPFRVILVIE